MLDTNVQMNFSQDRSHARLVRIKMKLVSLIVNHVTQQNNVPLMRLVEPNNLTVMTDGHVQQKLFSTMCHVRLEHTIVILMFHCPVLEHTQIVRHVKKDDIVQPLG